MKNEKLHVIAEAIFEKDRIFKQNEGIIMPIWNELPSVDIRYYYEMAENVIIRMKEKLSGIGYSTSNPEESNKKENKMINMDIDEIFKFLRDNDLNPKYVEFDETNFSRKIEFSTKYVKCWINWYCNLSELIVGNNYSNLIPFNSIKISTVHCSSTKTLAFYLKDVEYAVCQLSLQKLDWQEQK